MNSGQTPLGGLRHWRAVLHWAGACALLVALAAPSDVLARRGFNGGSGGASSFGFSRGFGSGFNRGFARNFRGGFAPGFSRGFSPTFVSWGGAGFLPRFWNNWNMRWNCRFGWYWDGGVIAPAVVDNVPSDESRVIWPPNYQKVPQSQISIVVVAPPASTPAPEVTGQLVFDANGNVLGAVLHQPDGSREFVATRP